MNIRLYNAKILTMEEGRELFEGEIWIRDDKIIYVGIGLYGESFDAGL